MKKPTITETDYKNIYSCAAKDIKLLSKKEAQQKRPVIYARALIPDLKKLSDKLNNDSEAQDIIKETIEILSILSDSWETHQKQ